MLGVRYWWDKNMQWRTAEGNLIIGKLNLYKYLKIRLLWKKKEFINRESRKLFQNWTGIFRSTKGIMPDIEKQNGEKNETQKYWYLYKPQVVDVRN